MSWTSSSQRCPPAAYSTSIRLYVLDSPAPPSCLPPLLLGAIRAHLEYWERVGGVGAHSAAVHWQLEELPYVGAIGRSDPARPGSSAGNRNRIQIPSSI